jgi:hypothetical protein
LGDHVGELAKFQEEERGAEQCSAAMVCAVRNAETCVKLAEQHEKLTELLGKAKP